MDIVAVAVIWYVVFAVSLTFHEAAHGFAAMKLGDTTACVHGLVTLDPVPHIRREPFGMVIVPILSFLLGGWMVGWASTPYDPYWAQNYRRKAALMSLAGPAANLALLLVAALAVRIGMMMGFFHAPDAITFNQVTSASPGFANSAAVVISILFSLNLILLVFNLIPLPPLDGSNILLFFLSDSAAQRYNHLISQPTNRIIGLIVAWNLLDFVLPPVHLLALNILYPGINYH